MSKKSNATKSSNEVEILKVVETKDYKPSELQFRDSALVGRSRPVADEDVVALADSLRSEGQQQAIQVRVNNGKPEVVFGNTRKRAGELIEKGYTGLNGKEVPANPNFTLRCEVVEVSDMDAFKHVVVENVRRNATSPVDNAYNQSVLRETYGMSDVAIAKLYGYASSASVHRLKKLLNLSFSSDILDMVHDGRCTLQAANDLEEFMSKEGIDAFLNLWSTVHKPAENETDSERLGSTVYTAEVVRDAIKAWKAAKKEAAKTAGSGSGVPTADGQPAADGTVPPVGEGTSQPSATGATPAAPSGEKGKGLSAKQMKDMLRGMTTERAKVPQMFKDFAAAFLLVCEGGDIQEFIGWVRSCGTAGEIAQWDAWDAEKAAGQTATTDQPTEEPAAV